MTYCLPGSSKVELQQKYLELKSTLRRYGTGGKCLCLKTSWASGMMTCVRAVRAGLFGMMLTCHEFEHGWETIDFKAQGHLTKWLTFTCFGMLGLNSIASAIAHIVPMLCVPNMKRTETSIQVLLSGLNLLTKRLVAVSSHA